MEIGDTGKGVGLVNIAPCKQWGISLQIYGIMLFGADVPFTSDILASGRVTAPTMCVHSLSESITSTFKSLI